MGEISFSIHISNKKSTINSKAKLAGAAKHNLRKYHSQDYSRDNITLLYGTTNLMQDVKDVYHKEFDGALHEYIAKQARPERRIDEESFDIFRREAVRSKRMTKDDLNMSNAELLDCLDLLKDGKLTRAAVLLFHLL